VWLKLTPAEFLQASEMMRFRLNLDFLSRAFAMIYRERQGYPAISARHRDSYEK
jgi:hypothetical protein